MYSGQDKSLIYQYIRKAFHCNTLFKKKALSEFNCHLVARYNTCTYNLISGENTLIPALAPRQFCPICPLCPLRVLSVSSEVSQCYCRTLSPQKRVIWREYCSKDGAEEAAEKKSFYANLESFTLHSRCRSLILKRPSHNLKGKTVHVKTKYVFLNTSILYNNSQKRNIHTSIIE